MSGDDKLCETCLTGLIKTGRKLKIDVISYEKELKKRKTKKSWKKATPSKSKQPKKIIQKKKIIRSMNIMLEEKLQS